MPVNYLLLAIRLGDLVKWSVSINEIDRVAMATLRIQRDSFPSNAITSTRAQRIYDWILSLTKASFDAMERERRLMTFCRSITPSQQREQLDEILGEAGFVLQGPDRERRLRFEARQFHPQVELHSRALFLQGNYFHAVFEAAKAYNRAVREKAQSSQDGYTLMMQVWDWRNGVLKITPCVTETDRNVQEGIKFLSGGLMQAVRNPAAHEPAVYWPISEADCLDILSFISFLFRKLDDAAYVSP